MNKFTLTVVIVIFCYNFSLTHSGRTDKNGGHWNHKSGTYHYHGKKNSSLWGNLIFIR